MPRPLSVLLQLWHVLPMKFLMKLPIIPSSSEAVSRKSRPCNRNFLPLSVHLWVVINKRSCLAMLSSSPVELRFKVLGNLLAVPLPILCRSGKAYFFTFNVIWRADVVWLVPSSELRFTTQLQVSAKRPQRTLRQVCGRMPLVCLEPRCNSLILWDIYFVVPSIIHAQFIYFSLGNSFCCWWFPVYWRRSCVTNVSTVCSSFLTMESKFLDISCGCTDLAHFW